MSKPASWSEDAIRCATALFSPRRRLPSHSRWEKICQNFKPSPNGTDFAQLRFLLSQKRKQSAFDTRKSPPQSDCVERLPFEQNADDKLMQPVESHPAPHTTWSIESSSRFSVNYDLPSLAAFINYDPAMMTLGEYLHRVGSFQHTYGLRFNQCHLRRQSEFSSPGMRVLHDIQALEMIFRPGNVSGPSADFTQSLDILHGNLQRIKKEVEANFQEIQNKHRTLHSSDFISWAYGQYKVGKESMTVRRSMFRPSPDSLSGCRRDIEDAITYYSSAEAINDRSATGVMVDVIVVALQRYLKAYLAAREPRPQRIWAAFRKFIGKRRGETPKVTMATSFTAVKPEDRLVLSFPEVF